MSRHVGSFRVNEGITSTYHDNDVSFDSLKDALFNESNHNIIGVSQKKKLRVRRFHSDSSPISYFQNEIGEPQKQL
jgi:hypothetical protein